MDDIHREFIRWLKGKNIVLSLHKFEYYIPLTFEETESLINEFSEILRGN